MDKINAIKIFGHPVRITAPDDIEGLKQNTITLNIAGIKWSASAQQIGFDPYNVDVQLRSRERDLSLSIITAIEGFPLIDNDIMKGFNDYPEAQKAFKEYLDKQKVNS